jgi:hypothetical protein
MMVAAALTMMAAPSAAQSDRFDLGPDKAAPTVTTGEALWPVPARAQWGTITTQKGPNIWKDGVFTDPLGRWQLVYPATLTVMKGDVMDRTRWFEYPGQPQIICGVSLTRNVFADLGAEAPTKAPAALIERRDALVAKQLSSPAAEKVEVVTLPAAPGASGTPVRAVSFTERGKLLEPLGVEREVVMRTILVSDDDDLLSVYCAAQPGQRGWVEKQALSAIRLNPLARTPRQ